MNIDERNLNDATVRQEREESSPSKQFKVKSSQTNKTNRTKWTKQRHRGQAKDKPPTKNMTV